MGKIVLRQLQQRPYGHASFLSQRSRTPLHCTISSLGYECRTGGDYDWDGAKRGSAPFGLLQLTLGGSGRLRWEGRDFTLRPGDLMLLQIPHDHRYWLPRSGRWELCYCCLVGDEALRLWAAICEGIGPVVAASSLEGGCLQAVEDLMLAALRDRMSPYRLSARVYELLMVLAMSKDLMQSGEGLTPAIQKAVALGETSSSTVGVDDLARAAGLSRYHFSRRFRDQVGSSPGAWLQELRLRRAACLLKDGHEDLRSIATACGFADANYFGKAFRKAYGVSPGVFRRSGMY